MTSQTPLEHVRAYAATAPDSGLAPWNYQPRQPRPDDVVIQILYCGVCHTDIHFVENDWGITQYPVVPGHEIIGRVTSTGPEVSRLQPGDIVGVGCLVDACRSCDCCNAGLEQYCTGGAVWTYNGIDRHDGKPTYGGYSEQVIVSDRFVAKVPAALDPAKAAPLLCAGITTYSPLRHVKVQPGDKVGVVGMGGLGHMGIKFAKAMGAEVTLFTRSTSKQAEAERHGVDRVVISTDPAQMEAAAGSLHYILDTVPVEHDLNPYLGCLKVDGTLLLVGQLTPLNPPIEAMPLLLGRRSILGSAIGGMPETQEVLDFCAEHNISCDVEMLDIKDIASAYERMKRGDVRYRFVIDLDSLRKG
jgi:uncharacterized zinc-type alcohol dehydrogenase-like protein